MEKKATFLLYLLISLCFISSTSADCRGSNDDESWGLNWSTFKTVGVGAVVGVTSVVAAPVVLAGVGFTTAGVAAGSLAAGVQAGLGTVAGGSAFAALQSAGAAGLAATTKILIGTTAGGFAAKFASSSSKDEEEGRDKS